MRWCAGVFWRISHDSRLSPKKEFRPPPQQTYVCAYDIARHYWRRSTILDVCYGKCGHGDDYVLLRWLVLGNKKGPLDISGGPFCVYLK